jgi:hypothetical protein
VIKKAKKLIFYVLVVALLIPYVPVLAANTGTIALVKKPGTEDTYTAAALAYYIISKDSNGNWPDGIGQNALDVSTEHTFDWSLNRVVKEVRINKYSEGDDDHKLIWDQTRKGTDAVIFDEVESSIAYPKSTPNKKVLTGKGTKVIHLEASTTVDLTAERPQIMAYDVNGIPKSYKYFVPFIIEIDFEPLEHQVLIQHFNSKTGVKIIPDEPRLVKDGEQITTNDKAGTPGFEGLNYTICKISYDSGSSWPVQKETTSVTETITKPTIIRFYYAPPGSSGDELMADLIISANPSAIQKGATASVAFTLTASGYGKNPITNYTFSFGDNKTDLSGIGSGSSNVKTTNKSGVAPKSKWYGKVTVTDSKGNTAEAEADITIGELEGEAKAFAKIQAASIESLSNPEQYASAENLTNYIDHIEYDDDEEMTVYLKADSKIIPKNTEAGWESEVTGLVFHIAPDATRSWATNGIEKYIFETQGYYGFSNTGPQTESGPMPTLETVFYLDQSSLYYLFNGSGEELDVWVTVNDRVQTNVSDTSDRYSIIFKAAAPPTVPPEVFLSINQTKFVRQETALFTPTFKETTTPIIDKYWEIDSTTNTVEDNGEGEIPREYFLDVPTGHYIAKQYITYMDEQGDIASKYAMVEFDVLPYFKPDVAIHTDKEKYVVPAEVQFITTFIENSKTYTIERKTWSIKTKSGVIIANGEGTCPTSRNFSLDSVPGMYEASQTIYWKEYGEEFTKTATCEFRIISPIPAAAFDVKMQMSKDFSNKIWQEVTTEVGKYGKQFKHIRIDLTPSILLNQELENPYPIDFANSNTQISITPISVDGAVQELERNDLVHTYAAADKKLVNNIITISGKQYMDVRFDDYGRYRIRARVANSNYTGSWLTKDIIIREDLPPIVGISFIDVQLDNNTYKTYRQDDLKVKFGVNIAVTTKDEDAVDINSAKLEISYDYNADNDSKNDGVHSIMHVTKLIDNLQPYLSVSKNESMNNFAISMFDNPKPILGKVRFEYTIGKDPVIPYFTGGDLPLIPYPRGSTYALDSNLKIVFVDNRSGFVKVEIGKEGKVEVIIMNYDTDNAIAQKMIADIINSYRGSDNTKVYIIDKNGKKELMN